MKTPTAVSALKYVGEENREALEWLIEDEGMEADDPKQIASRFSEVYVGSWTTFSDFCTEMEEIAYPQLGYWRNETPVRNQFTEPDFRAQLPTNPLAYFSSERWESDMSLLFRYFVSADYSRVHVFGNLS
jgi:hypothetical protein